MTVKIIRKITKEETLELTDVISNVLKKDEIVAAIKNLRAIAEAHVEKN